jgi:formate-dependent nitrite reductase membrane component NrfD
MTAVPPSTFFSEPPDWGWLIVIYFFLGGLAGGSYFLGVMIDFLGGREDRRLARLGYYIAFPCIVFCAVFLTVDLGRPERFWHMLIQSNTYRPIFKYWSPISVGAWALLIFGGFCLVSFLAALVEDNRLNWPAGRRLRPPGLLGTLIAAIGGLFGFFVAGYTGILLTVTNRPIWTDTPLLGMLFVVSAASISAALMILLAHGWGWTMPQLVALHRFDAWAIALEFLVLTALMVWMGSLVRAWLNIWGVFLVFGVVIGGMLIPSVIYWRGGRAGGRAVIAATALVLVGGFILRMVIVLSGQGPLRSQLWNLR